MIPACLTRPQAACVRRLAVYTEHATARRWRGLLRAWKRALAALKKWEER